MTAPQLSVVIVNWNAGDWLRRAIRSVVDAPPRLTVEIVVVDNASTDDSVSAVEADAALSRDIATGRVRFIRNSDNRGFAAANNQAFAASAAPYVLMLNPDAAVTPGAIDALADALSGDLRVGAVGPRLVNADGSLQVSVWKNPPAAWATLVEHLGAYRVLPRAVRARWLFGPHWSHDARRDVPMLGGAAVLVRRRVLDEVGGFDERFHMYGEDHEWSYRVVRAGWRLLFEPAATVVHQGAASSLQRWDQLEKLDVHVRAGYLLQAIVLPPWRVVANQTALCVGAAGQLAFRAARGADRRAVGAAFRLHRAHWRDAVRALVSRPSTTRAVPPVRSADRR